MSVDDDIDRFLDGKPHAVVGASRDPNKYGNKVLRAYLQNDRPVYAVNPNAYTVEGVKSHTSLSTLPVEVHGISIITHPEVTEKVIEEAARLGIKNVWMQPGAESEAALERAREAGMNVIAEGPCLLVVLRYHE